MTSSRPVVGSLFTLIFLFWARLSFLPSSSGAAVITSPVGEVIRPPKSNVYVPRQSDDQVPDQPRTYWINTRNKRSLDTVDDPYDQYGLVLKSGDEKRKWASGKNLAVWGKRSNDDEDNDDDVMSKRKWGGGNMAVWGKKRKWSSGNMAVWGKRGVYAGEGERPWNEGVDPADEEKRNWNGKNMAVWGRK